MFPSGEKDRGKPVRSRDNCNLSMNAYFLLSFTKFLFFSFAFQNALELSAPATPHLLQHQQAHKQAKPQGWMQLSGHPER